MEFQIEKQLTNARLPKTSKPEIITTPSPGGLRITEAGAIALGVQPGDFLAIIQAKVNGERMVLAFKGYQEKDADGKPTKTVGSKLASPNKQLAGNMQFGASAAYQVLGGNNKTLRHFDIGEVINKDGVDYFPLIYTGETDKAERQAKEEAAVQA